ncbi:hypothetical protein SELMODRAFT_406559 [Selaginella moellendorffii]|uniref:Uncharacterized protein n=1 Tax=Selaginella moellendorffii TaxID=88036 RepID=D8R2S6_SELML|nr:hypothetical protein SELMODRAFT_406559 [Selaginella moellendorffii]
MVELLDNAIVKELCHFHRDRQSHQFSRQKPRSSSLPTLSASFEEEEEEMIQPLSNSTRFAPQDTLQRHWDVSGAFRPIRDGLGIPTGFFLTRRRSPDDLAP